MTIGEVAIDDRQRAGRSHRPGLHAPGVVQPLRRGAEREDVAGKTVRGPD
jgi:hypothetical protein